MLWHPVLHHFLHLDISLILNNIILDHVLFFVVLNFHIDILHQLNINSHISEHLFPYTSVIILPILEII